MMSKKLVVLKDELLEVISHVIKVSKNKIKVGYEEINQNKVYANDIKNLKVNIDNLEFKENIMKNLKRIVDMKCDECTLEAAVVKYLKKYSEVLEKEEVLNNEHLASMLELIDQTGELQNKISEIENKFLEELKVEIEEKFNDAKDVAEIVLYLRELEEWLDSKECVYGDYAAVVLKMLIQKGIYMLENIDIKYSDEELINYFANYHNMWINNEYYDMQLRAFGEEGYSDVIAEKQPCFDNLALHPMFFKFLLADDEGLFERINLDEKYLYGIVNSFDESDESCDTYEVLRFDKDQYSKIFQNDDELDCTLMFIIKEYDGKIVVE